MGNPPAKPYNENEVKEIVRTGEGLDDLIIYGSLAARRYLAAHLVLNKVLYDEPKTQVAEQPSTSQDEVEQLKKQLAEVQKKFNPLDLDFTEKMKWLAHEVGATLEHAAYLMEEEDQRIAELEAQLAQQAQPEVDEHQQAKVDAMTKLLHDKGFGLYDIDPTAYEGEIWCEPCKTYRQGGCLIHGVPEDVQAEVEADNAHEAMFDAMHAAELRQQEAAKGVTESAEEFDLDPAAPHGGGNGEDRPTVVAQLVEPYDQGTAAVSNMIWGFVAKGNMKKSEPIQPEETPSEIVSQCAHCAELEQELETRRAASGELTKHNLLRIGELDDQVNSLRGKLGAAQKENNRLQQQVETLSTQLGEMENDFEVEDLRAELEKTQAEKHDLQQQLAQAKQDVGTLTDCDHVVKEREQTKAENEHLKKRCQVIDEKNQKLQARIAEQDLRMDEKNAVIREQADQIEALKAKLEEYEAMSQRGA